MRGWRRWRLGPRKTQCNKDPWARLEGAAAGRLNDIQTFKVGLRQLGISAKREMLESRLEAKDAAGRLAEFESASCQLPLDITGQIIEVDK